jgi:hypothetical protein
LKLGKKKEENFKKWDNSRRDEERRMEGRRRRGKDER